MFLHLFCSIQVSPRQNVVGLKLFLILQVFCICLKVDGIVTWDWKEVFWVYWIFFSILVGITFGIALLFITKLCSLFAKNEGFFELIGLLWLLGISLGISGGSSSLILGFLSYMGNPQSNIYFFTICGLAFYASLMILFTLIFWKTIHKFFLHVIGYNEEEESEHRDPERSEQGQEAQVPSNPRTKRISGTPKPISIPMYLVPFSMKKPLNLRSWGFGCELGIWNEDPSSV